MTRPGSRRVHRMITVAHEALIDLIVDADGHVDPRLGGAGFNVTRAVARLGRPVAYLGRLSGDRFGQLIRANLDQHGVKIAVEAPSAAPTTLAMVDLDPAGVPSYHFYLDGTSAAAVGSGDAVLPEGTTALHAGSLCLVMEPVGTSTEHMMVNAPDSVTVMLDTNCRPTAITARQDYLDRLMRIARRADLVKVSTEDLAYMSPGQDAGDATAELVAQGPACVLVTDGAAPVLAFAGGRQILLDVPAAPVVDTVGAGDAFGGAFLTWWLGNGLGRSDLGGAGPVRQAAPRPHPRRGDDHHAPRGRPPVGLRAGRTRRLAVAALRRPAWLTGPVTIPTVLSFILCATVDFALRAYGARRLLAESRFSLSRTIVAGLAGQALTSTIFTAMANGWHLGAHQLSPAYGVVLGFAALSWACGLLLAMAILVTWQAFIPAGTVPPPASWPRSLRSRAARSRRYWQIVRIFTRCGVRPLGRAPQGARSVALARSLTEALDLSGVVFVKFGQALSTRRDLLPPEFISELGRLQDRVSPLPWAQIERVLGEELGGTGVFTEIDTDPLASASIAQVHAATLRTGERVVVKVLRPGVTSLVERDLDIIARLARRAEVRMGWARAIGVAKLAEGFAAALREELDFRVEAGTLAAVGAAANSDGIVIPRAYHDLSTRRVLVMELLDGQALSKATPADCDRERLARELLDSLLRQIVVEGVFHADPHPGNILLLTDGRLALIDFGSVGRLDSGLRAALQRLVLGIDRRDPGALTHA